MRLRDFSFLTLCGFALFVGCGGDLPHGPQPATMASVTSDTGNPADAERARQIIYTATFHLAVHDLQETDDDIRQLIASTDGYLASYRDSGRAGQTRSGQWVLRLPHASFESFKIELLELEFLSSSRSIATT